MPWDPTIDSGIVAIHAALVPGSTGGEIVYFEGFFGAEAGRSFLFDCASGEVDELPPQPDADMTGGKNLFCSGHALLADGRWLVAGGWAVSPADGAIIAAHDHNNGATGIRDCFIYQPRARTWRRVAYMHTQPNSDVRGGGRWYPTLVTLGSGHVLAVGGHPLASGDLADDYPSPNARRHSNNIPERYSPGQNAWIELTEEPTAPSGVTDEYDRLHLAPSGKVFFSTLAKSHGDTRLFDAFSGRFESAGFGQHLDNEYDDANCSARTTSVILPILHSDASHFWILVCGAPEAERIDLRADEPTWLAGGEREMFPNDESPPRRNHLLGILLPTGQVFVGCGMRDDNTGVMSPEIYTPAIDWSTGQYIDDEEGSWNTLSSGNEQASVPRGYHSTALLQPDGSVWTAGSTHTGADITNPDDATQETRIEVYRPLYGGNRPTIEDAPECATYGESFSVRVSTSADMHRVAITRCGSFTHAFDGDQRYLTLPFTQDGDTLRVIAPSSPNLAPPGYYLLWVLRNETTPSEQGHFIRIAAQDHYAVLQLSTYSLLAVQALRTPFTESDEALFSEAIELYYEGYLPHELGIPSASPDISWQFAGGGNVPGMRIELNRRADEVDPVDNPDTAQRFRFVYDVIFEDEQAFDTFDDDETRNVEFRAELNGREEFVLLTLMKKANPFMRDGNPAYLSTDLRIHKARVGDVNAAGGPEGYLQALTTAFEDANVADDSDQHPFNQLDDSQDTNPVVLAVPQDDDGTYNFAIARVRYLSIPGEDAENVRVFFRLFNTVGTALEYNNEGTYRLLNGPAGKIAGLGRQQNVITSIPFFAARRVTPDTAMTGQTDDDVNRRTLVGKGPDTEFRYFGCWLDVNTFDPHFPRYPQDDGPYDPGNPFDIFNLDGPRSILSHIAGYHQCLVAEISYADDPIVAGQTPFTSDNLSQRNLATVPVENPGLEAITRTAQTSVDLKPSDAATQLLLQQLPNPGSSSTLRFRADELVFSRNNLPPGTIVELYLPDVSIDEVLALSTKRLGPGVLERVDDHTLRFEIGPSRYVALPGSREVNIAGLLSVTLPMGITKGDRYRLTVKQYSGRTRRFVGAFELVIPVEPKASLLPGEIEKLSILRYIFSMMPKKDRWYPVFERYLHEIGERVRGFGGDPDAVEPSPHGTGTAPAPCAPPRRPVTCAEGKICDVHYDCHGDFEAFTLEACDGAHVRITGTRDLERVVLMAWRERARVSVEYRPQCDTPVAHHNVCTKGHGSHGHGEPTKCADREGTSAHPVCPWSGRPVARDALVALPSGSVGFCSRAHRDRFLYAVKYFRECIRAKESQAGRPQRPGTGGQTPPGHQHGSPHQHMAAVARARTKPEHASVNEACPWTQQPVTAGALTHFEGHVVGFHEPKDRDAFARAVAAARPETVHQQRGETECCGQAHHEECPGHHEDRAAGRLVKLTLRC